MPPTEEQCVPRAQQDQEETIPTAATGAQREDPSSKCPQGEPSSCGINQVLQRRGPDSLVVLGVRAWGGRGVGCRRGGVGGVGWVGRWGVCCVGGVRALRGGWVSYSGRGLGGVLGVLGWVCGGVEAGGGWWGLGWGWVWWCGWGLGSLGCGWSGGRGVGGGVRGGGGGGGVGGGVGGVGQGGGVGVGGVGRRVGVVGVGAGGSPQNTAAFTEERTR
uniref:Uncharacterized protein n=1 Tax=Knipowitschia caucasica TaxID=637954 RepID=A0AAV2MMN1_KNICA